MYSLLLCVFSVFRFTAREVCGARLCLAAHTQRALPGAVSHPSAPCGFAEASASLESCIRGVLVSLGSTVSLSSCPSAVSQRSPPSPLCGYCASMQGQDAVLGGLHESPSSWFLLWDSLLPTLYPQETCVGHQPTQLSLRATHPVPAVCPRPPPGLSSGRL